MIKRGEAHPGYKIVTFVLVILVIFLVGFGIWKFDIPGRLRSSFGFGGNGDGGDGGNTDGGGDGGSELCGYKVAKILRAEWSGDEGDYMHFCLNQDCSIASDYRISFFYVKDEEVLVNDAEWAFILGSPDDVVGRVTPRKRIFLDSDELDLIYREAIVGYPEPKHMLNLEGAEINGDLICRGGEVSSSGMRAGVTWFVPIELRYGGNDDARYRYSPYTETWEILPDDFLEDNRWEEWYDVSNLEGRDIEAEHLRLTNRLIGLDEMEGLGVIAEYDYSFLEVDSGFELLNFPDVDFEIPSNYQEVGLIRSDRETTKLYRNIRSGEDYTYVISEIYIDLETLEVRVEKRFSDFVIGKVENGVIKIDSEYRGVPLPDEIIDNVDVPAFLISINDAKIKAGRAYKVG